MSVESAEGLVGHGGGSALPQVLTVEEVAGLMRVDQASRLTRP
jgi:hypothetical protein